QPVIACGLAEQVFPASLAGGWHGHALRRRSPASAGDDAATIRAEADKNHSLAVVTLAHELPNVELARVGHIGIAGVADVRVVLPHDGLGARSVVSHQP